MNSDDIDKAYVSPYDKFLSKFDATHPKSASQIKEINKHDRIATLRDKVVTKETTDAYWDKF